MKKSNKSAKAKPGTQLSLPDAIPVMAMFDGTQADMFHAIGELRGPFQGLASWPTLEEVLATKSKQFLEQHGEERWQQAGGYMDSQGRHSCERTSPIMVQAITAVAEAGGGLLWTDKKGRTRAMRLCPVRHHGKDMLYAFAIEWKDASQQADNPSLPLSQARAALEKQGGRLRLSSRAEQMLWVIHLQVLSQKCSRVIVPDVLLGAVIWGGDQSEWPDDWRHDVFQTLASLMSLQSEVFRLPSTGWPPRLGACSVAVSSVARLSDVPFEDDRCRPECPYWGGGLKHDHFMIEISSGFLGVLEHFGLPSSNSKYRTFNFIELPEADEARKAIQVARSKGQIISASMATAVFGPARWSGISKLQRRIFHALVGEITRTKKSSRPDNAKVICDRKVPTDRKNETLPCPAMQAGRCYVAFNGNGSRPGKGYTLFGRQGRGWMLKFDLMPDANADATDVARKVRSLFKALGFWKDVIGLIVVGFDPKQKTWITWSELRAMCPNNSGRIDARLATLHLRFYAPDDYLDRLQKFFQMRGGFATDVAGVANPQQFLPADDLKLRIRSLGIRQSEIAAELGVKQPYVSQLLNGERPWPAEHRARVEQMLADIESDQACVEADPETGGCL